MSGLPLPQPTASTVSPAAFETLSVLLRTRSGLVIGPDKAYLLEARLSPIAKREGFASIAELAQKIKDGRADALAREVVEAMTTNETFFFRDGKPFDHFRAHVLPKLIASRGPKDPIRIWSAACSTGQEAYSLAMIGAEMKASLGERTLQILGTDISRDVLQKAREGVFTQFEVQRGLPIQLLMKYFKKEGAHWRLSDAIRSMAEFREWNLLSDPGPLGRFDVLFCRNVLIYFDAPTKTKILDGMAKALAPDGVLYLGGAETVIGVSERFQLLPGERAVYAPIKGR